MKDKPLYYKDRLWAGGEEGFVGVVTLWSRVGAIADLIDKKLAKKVAVVGQLHTKRGIEFIFRNIWLKPRLRYLILWGEDGCGAGEALVDLMERGVTKGSFFEQVDKGDVETLRKEVKLLDMRGKGVEEVVAEIAKLEAKDGLWAKVKIFAESKPGASRSSENSVFRVEEKTIGEAWLQVLDLIVKFGRRVPRIHVYGGFERVLQNMSVVISGEDISNPKMWHFFDFDKDDLRAYFKNFFTAKREEEAYTYGERLFALETDGQKIDQVGIMAKKLASFEHNKGAIAVLWQAEIDNFGKRKPWRTPCLTLVQGFCVEEKLFLTAYFRSNDMFGAWPRNVFALRKLQAELAKRIGKKVGDLTIISALAFVDEVDMVEAEKIVKENKKFLVGFEADARGSLLISVEGEEIVIKHMSVEGEEVGEYRENGKAKRVTEKIIARLVEDKVLARLEHGMDVGCQLARAEMAVKIGLKFEQDKELR